jgi:hypothetical protein
VNVWPAIIKVPLRPEVLALAATEKTTVPLPIPEFPDNIEIQVSLLFALQAQLTSVFKATLLLPPADPNEPDVEPKEYTQLWEPNWTRSSQA